MSSAEVDPSKTTLFVGNFTVFVVGRITAVGGEFVVVVVETVVAVVEVVAAIVVVVVVVVIGSTTNVAVVVSDKPLSSVTVKLIV